MIRIHGHLCVLRNEPCLDVVISLTSGQSKMEMNSLEL
jgi:hypothetical protein